MQSAASAVSIKPSGTTASSPGRIASLDGVRAIAILLVIIGHMGNRDGTGLAQLARFGVNIFFVLSGYLITFLLQREHEQTARIDLTDFYRRRCCRIFPPAYLFILVVAILIPASRPGLPYALTYTVSWNLTRTPTVLFHLWSLSVEEQFYLLWPIALVLGYRHRARIAWGAVVIATIYRTFLALSPEYYSMANLHESFPGAMDSIAAGCLLAVYREKVKARVGWMADSPGIPIAVLVTAWILHNVCWGDKPGLPIVQSMTVFWVLAPMLIALWIFLMIERRGRILNNRVMSAIGVLSYSIYLWQQPLLVGQKFGLEKFLRLGVVVFIAALSYFVVERPMIRLGKRLGQKQTTVPLHAPLQPSSEQ